MTDYDIGIWSQKLIRNRTVLMMSKNFPHIEVVSKSHPIIFLLFQFQPNAQFSYPGAQDEHGAGAHGHHTAEGVSGRQRVPTEGGLPGHSGEWHLAGKPQLNGSKRKGKFCDRRGWKMRPYMKNLCETNDDGFLLWWYGMLLCYTARRKGLPWRWHTNCYWG